ncbi:hypothetical protein BHM03_00058137 [Ensete ventricosum]|nr:hypothetical protein BHM03_00058137 [Ensete ventricosum]
MRGCQNLFAWVRDVPSPTNNLIHGNDSTVRLMMVAYGKQDTHARHVDRPNAAIALAFARAMFLLLLVLHLLHRLVVAAAVLLLHTSASEAAATRPPPTHGSRRQKL